MESLPLKSPDVVAPTTKGKSVVPGMTKLFGALALTACASDENLARSFIPERQRLVAVPSLTFPFASGQFWAATRLYNPDNSADSSHMDYGGLFNDDRWAMDFGQSDCNAYGELVTPLAAGTVYSVEEEAESDGYGNTVIVEHADGYYSRYAHLSLSMVTEGEELSTATPLGKVGDTGYTVGSSCKDEDGVWRTGVHVHVALYKDGEGVLPEPISGMEGLEEGCWYNREGEEDNCGEGQPDDYEPLSEMETEELAIDFFDISPGEGVTTQNETDLVWVATVDSQEQPNVTLYIQNPEDPAWPTSMETFSTQAPWVYTFRKFPVKSGDYTSWVEASNDSGSVYTESIITPVSAPNLITLEITKAEVSPETGMEDFTEFRWSTEIISGSQPEVWLNIVNPYQPLINRFVMEVESANEGSWTASFGKTLMDPTVYTYWVEADNGYRRDTSEVHSLTIDPNGGWGGYDESDPDPAPDPEPSCDSTVPTDHLFIQTAIEAANEGDTVCVEAGTYMENLRIDGKTIHLKSLSGAENTVVDGSGLGSVISVLNGSNAVIEGFTLERGYDAFGGGILIDGASPTVQHCRITDNDFYGVSVMNSSLPVIQNTVIFENAKRGVYVSNWSEPEFNNVVIADNGTSGLSSNVYSHVTLMNSLVVDNGDEGVWSDSTSTVADSYNNVADNVLGDWEGDASSGLGSISESPDFVDRNEYRLKSGSRGIDEGNPDALMNDTDASRNDMGAYGGPLGTW